VAAGTRDQACDGFENKVTAPFPLSPTPTINCPTQLRQMSSGQIAAPTMIITPPTIHSSHRPETRAQDLAMAQSAPSKTAHGGQWRVQDTPTATMLLGGTPDVDLLRFARSATLAQQ